MELIYVSDKMVEYMTNEYPHLKEDDIFIIIKNSEIYSEEEIHHNYENNYTLNVNTKYYMEIPELICNLFEVKSVIPYLTDEEGILYKFKENEND